MPENKVYSWHHKFLLCYTKQKKTIVVMNDEGKLDFPDACDAPLTVITSKLFLDLISAVCPHYIETSETWFSQGQAPEDVGGGDDVGGGGADVGGEGKDVEGGGEGADVGGEGKDVEGGRGKDVGGRGKDVGGRGKGVGGRGKQVGGQGNEVGGVGQGQAPEDVGGGDDVGGGREGADVGGEGNDVESALRELRLSDLDKIVHSGLTLSAILSMLCSRPDPAAFETLIRTVVDDKAEDFFKKSNVILSSAIRVPRKGE
jgi:hypothetical protein